MPSSDMIPPSWRFGFRRGSNVTQPVENVPPFDSSSLNYQVETTVFDAYLRVDVSGTRTAADATAFHRWLGGASEHYRRNRLLIVMRLTGQVSTADVFEVASKFRESGLERKQVAVVDYNPESLKLQYFAADVGVNRGLSVAVFEDEEKAVEWLVEG